MSESDEPLDFPFDMNPMKDALFDGQPMEILSTDDLDLEDCPPIEDMSITARLM